MTSSRAELEREIAHEQAHVDRVYAHLEQATLNARSLARQGRDIYLTDRTNFVREEDSTALFERDAFAYQAARRLAVLDAEHEGLVFGRLDLDPDEVRHIGRIGVRDDDYEPLVIDWRAPAAEPFYRATQANPMGVVRRRVLRCRDDKVIGIEDDLLDAQASTELPIIGEGALMASLTRSRGHSMRDIVATIQAEQDEAIRAPYQGVTVIAGGPGTGKTVVALHRAAYLLYTHRARLERGGVLVVGPSEVFMNYIERVLPSLGEDSVTLRSIGAVATDVLGLSSQRVDSADAATLKGSLRMLPVLRRLVRLPFVDNPDLLRARVTVKGEVLTLEAAELDRIRDQVLARTTLNRGRALALDLVVEALVRKFPDDADRPPPEELDDLVREHAALQMFMNAWWPTLGPTRVLARLTDPTVAEQVAGNLTPAERATLVHSYRWLTKRPHDWSVADIALLDELADMLGPVPGDDEPDEPVFVDMGEVSELVTTADLLRPQRIEDVDDDPQTTYAHVLVDEGQDVTPLQWRMLRRRGPQASWTIVGDPAQSSFPHPEETSRAIEQLIGRAPHRTFTLSTNYRSPQEVFDLAARVITKVHPDADLPRAVRSTGVHPTLASSTPAGLESAVVEHTRHLASQVGGTVGVICPPSLLPRVRDALEAGAPDLAGQVVAVTALQSKGLEYDGVLVVSPDDVVAEAPGGERVLYVALTRATQRLTTLDLGPGRWREALG